MPRDGVEWKFFQLKAYHQCFQFPDTHTRTHKHTPEHSLCVIVWFSSLRLDAYKMCAATERNRTPVPREYQKIIIEAVKKNNSNKMKNILPLGMHVHARFISCCFTRMHKYIHKHRHTEKDVHNNVCREVRIHPPICLDTNK